jgi:hypothetical protein
MPLNFARDVQGFNTFAANAADLLMSATLASASHDSFTVPSNFQNWIVSFSFQPGSEVWVSINGTAAAPAGATFAATDSELLPGSRFVQAGDEIDVLNSGAGDADVGVQLYAIP